MGAVNRFADISLITDPCYSMGVVQGWIYIKSRPYIGEEFRMMLDSDPFGDNPKHTILVCQIGEREPDEKLFGQYYPIELGNEGCRLRVRPDVLHIFNADGTSIGPLRHVRNGQFTDVFIDFPAEQRLIGLNLYFQLVVQKGIGLYTSNTVKCTLGERM